MSQQFIPFEDDWDALSRLGKDALVPYRFEYGHPIVPARPCQRPNVSRSKDVAKDIDRRAG
jgi:hypothetical protein